MIGAIKQNKSLSRKFINKQKYTFFKADIAKLTFTKTMIGAIKQCKSITRKMVKKYKYITSRYHKD